MPQHWMSLRRIAVRTAVRVGKVELTTLNGIIYVVHISSPIVSPSSVLLNMIRGLRNAMLTKILWYMLTGAGRSVCACHC